MAWKWHSKWSDKKEGGCNDIEYNKEYAFKSIEFELTSV